MDINKCNKYYLKKNGTFRFYPNSMYNFILLSCLINDDLLYVDYYNKIDILGQNKKELKEKENILKVIKKLKCLTYKIKYKHRTFYYIFKEENIDKVLFIAYLSKIEKTSIKTIEKLLLTDFLIFRLCYKNYTNTDIFTLLFFRTYIAILRPILKEKFNKVLSDFSNYNDLYNYLKKNGYVDLYYNKYKPYILSNYKKYYKTVVNKPDFDKFKKISAKNISYYK